MQSTSTIERDENYSIIGSALLDSFCRLRVGYIMQMVAVDGAAQLHVPTGLKPLDHLDLLGNAQALHEGTGKRTLLDEIKRCRATMDLFRRSVEVGGIGGHTDQLTAVSKAEQKKLAATLASIGSLGLARRAGRQEAKWRTRHGAQFEPTLVATIDRLLVRLDDLAARVQAHSEPANAVVGNRNRLGAAHKLYMAAEQAVAWIEDERVDTEKDDKLGDKFSWKNGRKRTVRSSGIFEALKWLKDGHHGRLPIPRKAKHPEKAGRLFTLYRLAFLRDDEALPTKLRSFSDPGTNRIVRLKTINTLEKMLGRRVGFQQLWDTFEDDLLARVKPGMTEAQKRNAMNIDYVAKREVNEYRKDRSNLSLNQDMEFMATETVVHDLMADAF